jgi:hypothetical protein
MDRPSLMEFPYFVATVELMSQPTFLTVYECQW